MLGLVLLMPRLVILFLGIVLCRTATMAQVSALALQPPPAANSEAKKAIPIAAELALDAAKRWTQTAITDSSNLLPLERDILFVRLAAAWKEVDHRKAEDYLITGLDGFEAQLKAENSDIRNKPKYVSMLSGVISSDVMAVDRKAWNELMDQTSPRDARENISREAQEVADDDPAGAMELEKKSLALGGADMDHLNLESLIESHPAAASELFDQILATAAKDGSNERLLAGLIQSVFGRSENGSDGVPFTSFYNQDRQQRILDLAAKKALATNDDDSCMYAWSARLAISRFSPAIQGQLKSIASKCIQEMGGGSIDDPDTAKFKTTDDFVRAMNETSDVKLKLKLRHQAANHAAQVDKDYGRAVRICLDASEQERALYWGMSFDEEAVMFAHVGIHTALTDKDNVEFVQLLNLLPPRLQPELELEVVRLLPKEDKPQALLLLSHARSTLEQETPIRDDVYNVMFRETAEMAPQDLNLAWRVMVKGLNRFDQAQRTKLQSRSLSEEEIPAASRTKDSLYPWSVPATAVEDESFVRASVEDLDSPEHRARLRVGVINVFLSRYSEALKEAPAKSGNSVTATKN